MRAYSQDLRERVLRAVDQGKAQKEIVEALGVSLATIKRYVKQRREVGHVKPKAIPGRPPKKAGQLEAGLVAQVESHRDATLEQHCELWEQTHAVRVSPRTMSRAIKQVGWTRKKSRWEPVSATKRNEASGVSRRSSWMPAD
jgi:transposase